jgi:methylthioribulose-1-phosphate dehydratase
MAPSGVQKERMRSQDMFVLDLKGEVVATPEVRPAPHKPPKLSECSPLFMLVRALAMAHQLSARAINISTSRQVAASTGSLVQSRGRITSRRLRTSPSLSLGTPLETATASIRAHFLLQAYELRHAGAVIHSHSMNAVLATMLDPSTSEFKCTHLEMMKGIAGNGFYDNLVVPIVENTAHECELTDRMRTAMLAYPKSNAVLVRRHGVYVWGKTWIEAKTQAECYDYLFGIAVKMAGMGMDASRPPAAKPLAVGNGRLDGARALALCDSLFASESAIVP